nr:hypothetical protein [Fodinicola feengrottensis]
MAQVLAAVDEATGAGILTAGAFAHDLIREAARLEVATVERLQLHERMAEFLMGRSDADARIGQIAFHLLEALPTGDAALAVDWAERAAGQAMDQLAWEEAGTLYGRALAAGGPLGVADRCRLLLARAQALVKAYDVDAARKALLAAADLARTVGDTETIARASLTMEGVTDFVWDETGRALCDEALAAMPTQDSAVRARLLAQQVASDSWRTLAHAEAQSAEALEMAERVGDRRALVEALRARQFARSGPDGARDRLALGDRLLEVGGGGWTTTRSCGPVVAVRRVRTTGGHRPCRSGAGADRGGGRADQVAAGPLACRTVTGRYRARVWPVRRS